MEEEILEEVYDQKEDLGENETLLFDYCKKEYKKLADFLREKVFGYRYHLEHFYENVEFVKDDALKSFDILLQYSVLQLAINDGALVDQRVEIVEGVCRHGSLAYVVASKIPNFHWTDFTNVPVEEAYASLDLVYNQIGGFIGDFAAILKNYMALCEDDNGLEYFKKGIKFFLELIMVSNGKPFEIKDDTPCLIIDVINSLIHESGPFEEYEVVEEKES